MIRDSFIFYASFYEAMRCLDDAAYVAVSKAVNEYALYGNEIELDGTAKGFFQLIKPQIDANNKRYENGKKGAEYGKLGGRPRKNNPDNNPEENPYKTPNTENEAFNNPKENPYKTPNAKKSAFENPKENPNETPSVKNDVKPQDFAAKKGVEITAENGNFENVDFIDNEQTKTLKNPKQTPNVNENVNDNVNNNSLKGDFENSAVADATTPTTENDFSANPIENPASPEKEKSCAKKEKEWPATMLPEQTIADYKASSKKEKPQPTIEERAIDFWNKLERYKGSYGSEMLQAFYNYWSEYNEGGKKMRKEMEKVFNLPRRLATWAANEKKFGRKAAAPKTAGTNDVESIWKK